MFPAIDLRSGRSRYTSATLSSSSTATRFSPASTETSSSRFAFGSGARFGAVRRRGWALRAFRSGAGRSARSAGGASASTAAPLAETAEVFLLRFRPPRVPRLRLRGAVVVPAAAPSEPGSSAGPSVTASSSSSTASARSVRATSSDFFRRNQGSGKRFLLRARARAQPQRARVADGWEKPWHRPSRRVAAGPYAASTAGRSFARRAPIARSRWARRAQAHGSTSTYRVADWQRVASRYSNHASAY